MSREEAIRLLKTYRNCLFGILKEPIDMAIKAIDMWDKLFKSYEALTAEITESGDTKNATKRIDDWCVEQLRGIISDHYAELIIEDVQDGKER